MSIRVRDETDLDGEAIYRVVLAAFAESERQPVAELVRNLSTDPTAMPLLKLVAQLDGGGLVGYVLFSSARIAGAGRLLKAYILAPLAVHSDFQGQGVGRKLIEAGLKRLSRSGVELVFVLGHPGYYTRFGFSPAGRFGFDAPYPIPARNADAWMVLQLRQGILGNVTGRVQCADALNRPDLWRE